jgi:hypothetical protein
MARSAERAWAAFAAGAPHGDEGSDGTASLRSMTTGRQADTAGAEPLVRASSINPDERNNRRPPA